MDGYRSLGWILNHSEEGFFFLIASEKTQNEVVGRYSGSNVAIFDYKKTRGPYSFHVVKEFVEANSQARAYFLLNFQLAIESDADIQRLNFGRDMLARLEKNIVFCMTQRMDDLLAKNAFSFYSFIKLRLVFQDEGVDDSGAKELQVRGFDLSTGVDGDAGVEVDFTLPKERLLSQAISLTLQAERLAGQFRYRDALAFLRSAVAIREKKLGKKHPDTANTYSKIADIYDSLGDYTKALEWYEKALVICEKSLGYEHPSTAATYNNIALVYYCQGDYTKALEWYGKALEIYEKVLGKEHPDTAGTYNNIALVHYYQGDFAKALGWYEMALLIYEKVFGNEHPLTAGIYNNMAGIYDDQGDFTKALELYEKALAISEKVLGKEHPDTAGTYNNMALVYDHQGNYTKALEWYEKALAIYEKALGKEHPYTIDINNSIAKILSRHNTNAEKPE